MRVRVELLNSGEVEGTRYIHLLWVSEQYIKKYKKKKETEIL